MHTPGRLLVVPAVLLTVAACANGTDDLLPGYYEEQAGGGGLGGDGGAGGEDLSVSSSSSSSVSAGSTGAGGAEGVGGDVGSNEGDGGDGGGGAVAECDHAAPNTCTGAEALGSISGDVEADSMTVTGTTSKWFKILIVDNADEASSEHFRATLESPPGMNFDLIAYQGQIEVDAPNCFASGVRGQGTPESFYVTWNDRFADPDELWFILEVRHVEGTACGEDARWTLTLLGNNAALIEP
ncbi:hypothetical protein WME95_03045 [Sorangium sp. So ce327]|jgi:hypothetical protein|uniref:hypothetical protein n=1 Tax=unclassified Sorangium TaxID=2621164 RepID=UPI003F62C993